MTTWILTCPNCGTGNEVLSNAIVVKCGIVSCRCNCSNCKQEMEGRQEYWQWLGLAESPSAELEA